MKNLMDLPVLEACEMKYQRGVQEHRGGNQDAPFVGDPVSEVHDEALDTLNYCPQLRAEGHSTDVIDRIESAALEILQGARLLR